MSDRGVIQHECSSHRLGLWSDDRDKSGESAFSVLWRNLTMCGQHRGEGDTTRAAAGPHDHHIVQIGWRRLHLACRQLAILETYAASDSFDSGLKTLASQCPSMCSLTVDGGCGDPSASSNPEEGFDHRFSHPTTTSPSGLPCFHHRL